MTKFSVNQQAAYSKEMRETVDKLLFKINDIYNSSVATDAYLEKYLPYNI